MKLVIDFGNTLQKFARFNGKEIADVKVFRDITPAELKNYIADEGPFEGCILSSVTDYREEIKSIQEKQEKFIELSHLVKLPIRLQYQTPETLGRDRIAAAVGGWAFHPGNDVLVIDAGTCITYDLTTKDGDYLGGAISPGIQMRFRSMRTFTGKLPLVEMDEFDGLIGRSTRESILSGVINGVIEEINGVIRQYRELYPELIVIITGGDHQFLHNKLKNSIFAAPELVLQGLNEILDHNDSPE